MKRFEIIEHTADIGLIAYGVNLADAFANAAYGLFSIITDIDKLTSVESRRVSVNAQDIESLLFNWLNQLIYLFDVEHLLFHSFNITVFSENELDAICHGEKYNAFRHRINMGVKSATYHTLEVDAALNKVQVIFDV